MSGRKITMDGAVMRNKLRGALAKEIAALPKSTEALQGDPYHVTLDRLIDRAREIDATAAKGETL